MLIIMRLINPELISIVFQFTVRALYSSYLQEIYMRWKISVIREVRRQEIAHSYVCSVFTWNSIR